MNWEQFKAIVWLRWRLTRNRFRRGGPLNAVFSVLLLAGMVMAACGTTALGFLLGMFGLYHLRPLVLGFVFDGIMFFFLIFWFVGLLVEIQRSESIDLSKLLHLPVTLQQVFAFNYGASLLTPIIVITVPGMLALCAGIAVHSPAMVLVMPVVIGLIFAITAWTYCLRGWLAALMTNKRRRRAIIVWLTLALVLVGQLPNIIFNTPLFGVQDRIRHHHRRSENGNFELPDWFSGAHAVVPVGWPGLSAMELKDGNVTPALGLAAAGFLLGALGLMRAYRLTVNFYSGSGEKSIVRTTAVSAGPARTALPSGKKLLVEKRLPWLADDTGGLTLATFRSLTRAPELKMALIMPAVIGVIMASAFLRHVKVSDRSWMGFAGSAAVVLTTFSLAPTMSNSFGLDRNGFRALVLLPLRRDRVLLAKNLAFFPFMALVALLLVSAAELVLGMPWMTVAVALLQIPTAFLLCVSVTNFFSILVPYRLAAGSLKAAKPKAMVILAAFAATLLTPVILAPLMIPPALQWLVAYLGWPEWLPFNGIAAIVILALVVLLYVLVLPFQGRLLQRREQKILQEVTEDVE